MRRDRWSWRARAQGRAADTGRTSSAGCIKMVGLEEALRGITPKLLRCIGLLQRRTLMWHSAAWATCTMKALALLETTLKRCGCSSLLPPKDILQHCTGSLAVTRKVEAFVKTRPKPFAGTGAQKQRVTMARESSGKGSRYGQYALGKFYECRKGGVARNYAEAVALYRLAAAQNLDGAQFSLGFMYYQGHGVAQDSAEALAAAQGHCLALYWVALFYEEVRGVGENEAEAIRWYRRAQAAGHPSLCRGWARKFTQ